ncbi:GvpL/GvpF family gas vesicle protein [Geodermatophilus sp. SYSU D00684]
MTGPDVPDRLTRVARELGPEVLADAVVRGRELAVERLAGLLADALVAEVLAGRAAGAAPAPAAAARPEPAAPPGPSVPPESAPPPVPPPRTDAAPLPDEVLYAFALTRADLPVPADPPGAPDGGRPLELVTDGDLGLLVRRVPRADLEVDPDDLSEGGRLALLARGHDAVVRAAVAAGPVLPLRLGTAVPDATAARRLLAEHAAVAREQLTRIGDAREWGVRLVRPADGEEAGDGGPRPDREELTGTAYLAQRRQALRQREEAARDAARAADRLEQVLDPHVRECLHRGAAPASGLLLDLACLVAPDAEEAFLAAVGELRTELEDDGLALEVSGPWPPYSFAALTAEGSGG